MPDRNRRIRERRSQSRNRPLGCQRKDLGKGHGAEWRGDSQRPGSGSARSLRRNGRCGKRESPPVPQVHPGNHKRLKQRKELPAIAEILGPPFFNSLRLCHSSSFSFSRWSDLLREKLIHSIRTRVLKPFLSWEL